MYFRSFALALLLSSFLEVSTNQIKFKHRLYYTAFIKLSELSQATLNNNTKHLKSTADLTLKC